MFVPDQSQNLVKNRMKFNSRFKIRNENVLNFTRKAVSPSPINKLQMTAQPSSRNHTPHSQFLYERRNLVETAKLRCKFKRMKSTSPKNQSEEINKTVISKVESLIKQTEDPQKAPPVVEPVEVKTFDDERIFRIEKESWRDFSHHLKQIRKPKVIEPGNGRKQK